MIGKVLTLVVLAALAYGGYSFYSKHEASSAAAEFKESLRGLRQHALRGSEFSKEDLRKFVKQAAQTHRVTVEESSLRVVMETLEYDCEGQEATRNSRVKVLKCRPLIPAYVSGPQRMII